MPMALNILADKNLFMIPLPIAKNIIDIISTAPIIKANASKDAVP